MELHGLVSALGELVGGDAVCRLFGADMDDLKMLAELENQYRRYEPKG